MAAVWVAGRGAGQPFTVHAVINYPTQYGILYPFLPAVCLHSKCLIGLYHILKFTVVVYGRLVNR